MPLKALRIKPGVFKENTRYIAEGRWYDSDKVRFRSGQPEKIGGWVRATTNTFVGACTSLFAWATNWGAAVLGVMTSTRQYVSYNGSYADIGYVTYTSSGTITATPGSSVLVVSSSFLPNSTLWAGSWVTISNATGLGGNITATVLNKKHTIVSVTNPAGTFTIDPGVVANASDTGTGGAFVSGFGEPAYTPYYSQANFGQDLLFGRSGGRLYVFKGYYSWLIPNNTVTISIATPATITTVNPSPPPAFLSPSQRIPVVFETTGSLPTGITAGTTYYMASPSSSGGTTHYIYPTETSGTPINTSGTQSGVHTIKLMAEQTPIVRQNFMLVSDISRIVLVFGCNNLADDAIGLIVGPVPDPMLIRWSDQESYLDWTPSATTQAGEIRLSRGSRIEAVAQVRQEILVWTDIALYSMQYLGPPEVWSTQLLADNISIASGRAWAIGGGVTYWMGQEKFYMFDGRMQTLNCDLRQYIFTDFNFNKILDVFASTVEQFNEVWWFYCSANSQTIDRYVVYNYAEQIWYHGSMDRTAWLDAGIASDVPLATDYSGRLLSQETGCDNNSTGTPQAIAAQITSSEFDIDDGQNFSFIWRALPDVTFNGSTTTPGEPSVQMSILTLQNSGSGYTRGTAPVATTGANMSVAGVNSLPVTRIATTTVERFTEQVNIRVRARQMAFKIASEGLGVQWQLGTPRLDVRPDGRKS